MVLAALIGGGYGVYWYLVMQQLEKATEGWFADWRRDGYDTRYRIAGAEGFPLLVRLRLEDVRLADPGGAWRWEGDAATLEIQPWEPTAYRLELLGTQTVAVPIAGRFVETVSEATSAVGYARSDLSGRLRYASIDLTGLRTEAPTLSQSAKAERLALELDLPAIPPSRHFEPAGELQILADGLSLPRDYHGPLGPKLDRLSARLVLMGPMERGDTERMLTAWRDAGGVLDLRWLRLDWGPLRLAGEGAVALDGFLRPVGALTARIRGIDQTTQRFAEAGLIDRTVARLLSAGLQLLAVRPSDGSEPYVEAPLEAQDGKLYIGPMKVADLPPVLPKRTDIDRAAPAPIPHVEAGETLPAPAE